MTGIRNGYDGIVGVLLQVHQKEQRKLRRGSDKPYTYAQQNNHRVMILLASLCLSVAVVKITFCS
jgi:hypothetical protein